MSVVFYLILTFWGGGAGTIAAVTVPITYATVDACYAAGNAASVAYTLKDPGGGYRYVNFTCVPAQKDSTP